MGTIHLNKESFAARVSDVLESGQWKYLGDKPAIIDFFATWCGPCQALAPTLDAAAERFADQIYVYKVDVDEEPELASLFNIRSIPTLLFVPMQGKPRNWLRFSIFVLSQRCFSSRCKESRKSM